MENQEQKTYTEAEIKENLEKAIELQELQTKLQELRTRMVTARANEFYAIRQINELMHTEQAQPENATPTAQNQTVTPTMSETTPFAESVL